VIDMRRARLRVSRKAYCRKGTLRKEYTRDHTVIPETKVKGSCVKKSTFYIKDVGAPGRGKKLFKVKRGLLKKHGYSTHLPEEQRHEALRKADRDYGSVRLWKMLNAQVVYRKRLPDGVLSTFRQDRDWVMKNLINPAEARTMTRPAVKKWKGMSHHARQVAMPGGKI